MTVYQNVLLPLDGSKVGECAIPWAQELAKRCGSEKVTLVRVIKGTKGYKQAPDYSKPPEQQLQTQAKGGKEKDAEQYLAVIAKKLLEAGVKTETKVLLGDPAQAIVFYAEHNPCDVIVMASHGRGSLGRALLGSAALKVFRGTCKPVLMVRGPGCVPGV
ncbi:MAG: universal stress protein [Chloroflexi bacterium]|nr:universal stress protein [Chloroflexota bacterium]